MQERPEDTIVTNPLRDMTPAQFMALGGSAVVFVRPIKGKQLAQLMAAPDFGDDEDFELVVSADGSPLLVADSKQAVAEWLADKTYGIVTLH